ncbi:hypothetical protein L3Q82_024518 [Scortum barcoo]|uniref:Uncharacterized protein n=1 Tax=Scortum barcoo TaxID=214431 RepID=A0ACB8WPN1_9TELE|nr:hypothetical protein L3Q82_024518 [Scortum barcoo]
MEVHEQLFLFFFFFLNFIDNVCASFPQHTATRFYAVQWHPEKVPYEWIEKPGMVHSRSALRVCFYTAIFFVSEAKKSQHHFSSPEEESKALIYNFPPVFSGMDAIFVQNYYFD